MPKMLVSVEEAMSALSLGRSKLLELTYSGEIPSVKVGRRRLFSVDELQQWVIKRSNASGDVG